MTQESDNIRLLNKEMLMSDIWDKRKPIYDVWYMKVLICGVCDKKMLICDKKVLICDNKVLICDKKVLMQLPNLFNLMKIN